HRILENILCSLEEMLDETQTTLSAIGICCPGPIDIENGLVVSPTNLPNWINFPIVEILKKKFGVPVVFDNDANAAALGEFYEGAGREFRDILYVTISTGIGGAIICGGQIHHGVGASAGEIGHAIVQPNGILCRCGTKGCLETIASGLSIARRAKEKSSGKGAFFNGTKSNEITAKTVIEAVKNGDETALAIWDETIRFLAIGIGNAITIIAPEAVIIGGGVSMAGDILFDPLRRHIAQNVKMLPIEKVKILPALLAGQSGVFGALILARQAINNFVEII
ncbi:MAG: ROK family protein, partial [Pyrinomonadaceae bacterium]